MTHPEHVPVKARCLGYFRDWYGDLPDLRERHPFACHAASGERSLAMLTISAVLRKTVIRDHLQASGRGSCAASTLSAPASGHPGAPNYAPSLCSVAGLLVAR